MRLDLSAIVVLSLAGRCLSARILAILPFPSKSHFIFHTHVLKALAARGHQVTEYSPFPPKTSIPNYTHVEIQTSFEKDLKVETFKDFQQKICKNDQPTIIGSGFRAVWDMTYAVCEETLKHEQIKKLLKSKEHFDLVITESSFGQESMVVFGHRFNVPTVTLQTFYTWSVSNSDAGNALSIASVPGFKSIIATSKMSFTERFINFFSTITTLFDYYNNHLPTHEKFIKQHYSKDAPPLEDMVSNISLYLINTHPAVEYPQPYTPNIVPIGGITISPERLPLPKDVKKFMDEAKEGVIYFSFGTVVPAQILPNEVFQIFINVFKKLKQRVLWKIEIESLPGLPDNVMLTKWVPQPGVLAHPNCVLFLTHGGLLGQHETLQAGVPTVGVPFFGDQRYNLKVNEFHGVGIKFDFMSLSEETLFSALETVLSNPQYKENAVRLSRIYRDRPLSPADTAVFWVEYVLRHGGAHHLRPAAAQLSWYQLALLDVLAVVLAAMAFISIMVYLAIKILVCSMFREKKEIITVKNAKKTKIN